MREQLIRALLAHAQGDIQKHVANVEVYLTNPAGIGEHPDLVTAVACEVTKLAAAEEKLNTVTDNWSLND